LIETIHGGWTVVYSLDQNRYVALCRSCHNAVDAYFARGRRLDVARCIELYGQGVGARTIAARLGCTRDLVFAALREAGVLIRSSVEASRLQRQPDCHRGHRLVAPNLCKSALPGRACLACNRARSAAKDARVRRGEVWTEARRTAVAHAYYARIMSTEESVPECPRGHRRVAPNLTREGHCLACKRARVAASAARKRHGEVWSEDRRKAVADARYAEIMGAAAAA